MEEMDFNKLKGIEGLNIYFENSIEPNENEPIVKTAIWDKLKNKIKKNNLKLLPAADLKNKTHSQYATSTNPDEIVHLSKIAKASLELDDGFVLTKTSLKEICEEINENCKDRVIDITKKDAKLLENYLDSNKNMLFNLYSRIVYDKDFLEYVKNNDIIYINMKQLKKFGDREELKGKDLSLEINQDEFDMLSKKEIKEIDSKYDIKEYHVRMNKLLNFDTKKLSELENELCDSDKFSRIFVFYRQSVYSELDAQTIEEEKEILKELISNIDENDTDLEKFMKIYTNLLENISYNNTASDILREVEKDTELVEEVQWENSNLLGLLTRNYSMCRGCINITMRIK